MNDQLKNDVKFARALAAGKPGVWEEFYLDYKPRIFAVCKRMMRFDDLAEDLTQTTIIQIFRKIGSFKGDSRLSTWIHRIAVNQCLMHFRSSKVHRNNELEANIPNKEAGGLSFDDQMDIKRLLPLLSNGYRNVLVLHDYFGFEHKEIAAILNCSEGTSKSQLHKARQKARKIYNEKINPKIYSYN